MSEETPPPPPPPESPEGSPEVSLEVPPETSPEEIPKNPPAEPREEPQPDAASLEHRRCFLTKASAVVVGGIVGIVPAAAGLMSVLDPIRPGREKAEGGLLVPVTTLDALPADGKPRQFVIRADLVDAWNKTSNARIGAVYLVRTSETDVKCLSVICPHAGCFVASQSDGSFKCPCHDSEFETDGKVREKNAQGQTTVSPRDLDTLDVEIKDGRIFVKYERFRAGTSEKIPQT